MRECFDSFKYVLCYVTRRALWTFQPSMLLFYSCRFFLPLFFFSALITCQPYVFRSTVFECFIVCVANQGMLATLLAFVKSLCIMRASVPSTIRFERASDLSDCVYYACRDVLMNHLDEEVDDLRGENMKKYWTLEEVDRIMM